MGITDLFSGGTPISTIATGLASGVAGFYGQREANQANSDNAYRTQEFQREMSNTAYTRASNDLTNAGFNKLLATGAQASTPSGATATAENAMGGLQSAVRDSIGQAMQYRKQSAEIQNLDSNNKLQNAQAKQADTQAIKNTVDAEVGRKGIPESEIKNDIYDLMRPAIKGIKGWFQNGAKQESLVPDAMKPKNYHPQVPLNQFWKKD